MVQSEGFHLYRANPLKIKSTIEQFQKLGVQRVAPCHCTGPEAQGYFQRANDNPIKTMVYQDQQIIHLPSKKLYIRLPDFYYFLKLIGYGDCGVKISNIFGWLLIKRPHPTEERSSHG